MSRWVSAALCKAIIYLPDLEPHEQAAVFWGATTPKIHKTNLRTIVNSNVHLVDIDKKSKDMFFRLVKQVTERDGATLNNSK